MESRNRTNTPVNLARACAEVVCETARKTARWKYFPYAALAVPALGVLVLFRLAMSSLNGP